MKIRAAKKCMALLILAVLLFGATISASAEEVWDEGLETGGVGPNGQYFPTTIYMNGEPADIGYMYVSTYYMPVDTLCAMSGIEVNTGYEDGVWYTTGDNFSMFYEEDACFICVNHRYFYAPYGFVCFEGRVCIPVSLAERLFHIEAYIVNGTIEAYTEGIYVEQDDADYYAHTYGEANYNWLCRVIFAEGYREDIVGKIAVGNVVMNRVNHSSYPDNVKDVVFDTVGGIQFATTREQELYDNPDRTAQIAAAICLEGYNFVEDCLFFVSPSGASTEWFDNNLIYYCEIGNHRFYRWLGY